MVVVYNPSCSNPNFSSSYEKLLLDLLEQDFDRTYIVGDFNVNVAASTPSTNLYALRQINSTFKLIVLPTGPTRITENSSTTIDLLITNSPDTVIKSKTASANAISDHEIVYLLANIKVRKPAAQTVLVRNMRGIDQLQLQAAFEEKDTRPFYDAVDVDAKVAWMGEELNELLQRFAPERSIIVRDRRTPWITNEIEQAVALRDLAFALYRRNPNRTRGDVRWRDYTSKRNRASSLVMAAKRRYAEQHFSTNLPAKTLWSNLRREGIHNNPKKNAPVEGTDAEELNQFFAEGHREHQEENHYPPVVQLQHRSEPDHGVNALDFRHTDANEVCRMVYEIQTNATGSDGIPISFVKLLCPFILPLLAHLFNLIIDTSLFPSAWKKGIITPIPKSPNPTQPKDFRPISVLPAISKVLEKILLAQITAHLNEANPPLLARNQSGYRKGFSTTTALTKVVHDIYSNFDDNRCTVMVLVDFSLAFNCVDHRLLKSKLLNEFKFSRTACELISSFLRGRTQAVRLGNVLSAEKEVLDGTPQGSCLSAILFSLYINSLPEILRCEWQLYADDLQIYLSGPADDVDRLVRTINEDLGSIVEWAKRNRLSPNPKKTQAIVFSRNGSVTPRQDIIFNGMVIPLSNHVTNLGLHMDSKLSWTHQVNDIMMKVYNTLRTFRKFATVLTLPTRLKLVQAVVMPFFTYADIVYYPGLSAALREQLHRCFKSTVRFVHNLRRRDTTVAVRHSILGHDLPTNYRLRVCCFMKQAYERSLPGYLMQHIQHGRQERTAGLIVPRHTTSSGKSVLVNGAICWNGLPTTVKQERRLMVFKRAVTRL